MLKVYWTIEPETPSVYHSLRQCPGGKSIKGYNRDNGKIPGDREPCKECVSLSVEWIASLVEDGALPTS